MPATQLRSTQLTHRQKPIMNPFSPFKESSTNLETEWVQSGVTIPDEWLSLHLRRNTFFQKQQTFILEAFSSCVEIVSNRSGRLSIGPPVKLVQNLPFFS